VAALSEFLVHNGLTEMAALGDFGALTARLAAQKSSWLQFAVHHYLFFRIPLIRPHKFLQRSLPVFGVIFSRGMFVAVGLISIIGLYLASRQWDAFVSTFLYFFNLEGAALYALCLVIVKSAHEFGHAYMATRYGVRAGTMGVAFLVLMPVLYTDVTGAWKLRSRKQRLLITSAGLIAELMIAGLAIFVWAIAPEGPVRSAAFFMAVASLGTSLLINLNPFMRFDGYYLLSDAIGIANLQSRAFALGRWRLRRLLFGLKAPNPDDLSPALTGFCIAYAYMTWLYRLVLFAGIALYVYHFFIKAAGIILFLIEIGAFILWPICKEFAEWWRARWLILREPRVWLTTAAALLGLTAICLPLSHSVRVPAILRAETDARVFAPRPAMIAAILVQEGAPAEKGQVLFELRSPQLEQDRLTGRRSPRYPAGRRSADGEDRSAGLVRTTARR
jgi:putative peptide zinc metalloprotease protein